MSEMKSDTGNTSNQSESVLELQAQKKSNRHY